jgi:hypothetical protein
VAGYLSVDAQGVIGQVAVLTDLRSTTVLPKPRPKPRQDRAARLKELAVTLLDQEGNWLTFMEGRHSVLNWNDDRFSISVSSPFRPDARREDIEAAGRALSQPPEITMDIWSAPQGKVLSLSWGHGTTGDDFKIITFQRGDWEQDLIQRAVSGLPGAVLQRSRIAQ